MSRDKYSNDHTIKVDEGAGSLNIEANVNITGDLAFTGQLDIDALDLSSAVNQTVRFMGNAFRPDDDYTPDVDFDFSISSGRLVFINAGYFSLPLNLPHGATITSIRVYGIAEGASDTVILTLRKGGLALATATLVNEGAGDTEQVTNLTHQIDYTDDDAYWLRVFGNAATTSASILFADVVYTIQTFPQNSQVAPV